MSRQALSAAAFSALALFAVLAASLAAFVVFELLDMERQATAAAWVAVVPTLFFGVLLAVCVLSYVLAGLVWFVALLVRRVRG